MTDALWVLVQRALPQRALCRFVFRVGRSRKRWLKSLLIRWFARQYAVDMSEAAEPRLDAYDTFNDFFTRALEPGARPVDGDPASVVSPVDGRLTEFGHLDGGRLLQAKGRDYSLEALLAEPSAGVAAYRNGAYATIYLAPRDYHRIHAPKNGRLTRTKYVPGARFTVNRMTATRIDALFARNERALCMFDGPDCRMIVAMIGALNVSSISTAAQGEIPSGAPRDWPNQRESYSKGAEIGRFNLGSTVILLFENGAVRWRHGLSPGRLVRVGEAIGDLAGGLGRNPGGHLASNPGDEPAKSR